MSRYYFHLHNGVDAPDLEGVELRDMAAALLHAMHSARFTAAQTVKELGHIVGGHHIDIEDADGQILETVYFRDAVKIEA